MYQALYREYRPKLFKEAIGHVEIKEILKNQLKNNQAGHAYLFTGVRGTGKTTFAKILAKAFNCLDLQEGEPCLKCEQCIGIENGSIMDVVEMDAASNTGVDNIRGIIEEATYLPTMAKFRVYIIDEVHMLSQGAFNALLKTLEEPPPHVKFILATTEPQKIPATIHSRCQRFEFNKISDVEIFEHIKKIAKENEITINDDALMLIANLGEGSVRDAISILESVKNISGKIEIQDVRNVIGLPTMKDMLTLCLSLINSDENILIEKVYKLIDEGKEPQNLIEEMIRIFEASLIKERETVNKYSKEEKQILKKISQKDRKRQYLIIKKLSELNNTMRWAKRKKAVFLSGLLELIVYDCDLKEPKLEARDMINILEKGNQENDNKIIKNEQQEEKEKEQKQEKEQEKQQKNFIKQLEQEDKKSIKDEAVELLKQKDKEKEITKKIKEEDLDVKIVRKKFNETLLQRKLTEGKHTPQFILISSSEILVAKNKVYIKRKEESPLKENDLKLKTVSHPDTVKILKENMEVLLKENDVEIIFEGWSLH